MRVVIAMMRTPDGHSRLEISRFLTPPADAPVNALGYLRIMFAVEDIDDTLARLRPYGAELVGELAQYEDKYRLCYVRGLRGSSSGWPSRSASASNFRTGGPWVIGTLARSRSRLRCRAPACAATETIKRPNNSASQPTSPAAHRRLRADPRRGWARR
jgi:hypothetical protein